MLYNDVTGTRFRPQWWTSNRYGIQMELPLLWEIKDHAVR